MNGKITDVDLLSNKVQDLERKIKNEDHPRRAYGLDPGPQTVQRVLEGREPAIYRIGNVGLQAHGDRVIIEEDDFRSGMGCPRCNPSGTASAVEGKSRIPCPDCRGSGKSPVVSEATCKACKGEKTIICPDCGGVGAIKGGILIADTAVRRPTTGTIKSIGPGVHQNGVFVPTSFKEGENVMYSNMAGYAMDIDDRVVRILHEVEIFSRVHGHLELYTASKEMPDSHDSFNASMLDRGRK